MSGKSVQQVMQVWSAMDMRRRFAVAGASVAMFVAIIVMSRMAAAPSMSLLYSGLDPAAAGEVMAELESLGVAHEIRGEAIFVPEDARDALRLSLAAEGLPSQGIAGYELLDSLSGFGTTAQMFDAAWSRAVEGELVRTILSNPAIRAARVHIARGTDQPFVRGSDPTASVSVTTVGGLSPDQAQALRHLVAAAVTGLRPDRVEVIDSVTGRVAPGDGGADGTAASARAETIRRNVERLLAARVGQGQAVVEVSVDLVTESELVTERRLDPQGRVAVSTQTESLSGSEDQPGGAVTVASNLPDGDAAAEGATRTQSEESRERVDYQVSETRREVTRTPGDIRRMGVAVLIDGERVTQPDGTVTWTPRSDEELAALRELVASAAGIDEARGDVLTIKSLELVRPETGEAGRAGGWPVDLTRLAGLALLAAVILAVGLFVLRPALRGAAATQAALALPPVEPPVPDGPVLEGEIADGYGMGEFARIPAKGLPDADGPEDPVARLRRMIGERQAESIEILRNWMDPDGGKA